MRPTVASILQDHVSLSVRCLDRIYLNGYVPRLQTSGQLCFFLRDHLGFPLPSPALFRPLHDRFIQAIDRFATDHTLPLVQFARRVLYHRRSGRSLRHMLCERVS